MQFDIRVSFRGTSTGWIEHNKRFAFTTVFLRLGIFAFHFLFHVWNTPHLTAPGQQHVFLKQKRSRQSFLEYRDNLEKRFTNWNLTHRRPLLIHIQTTVCYIQVKPDHSKNKKNSANWMCTDSRTNRFVRNRIQLFFFPPVLEFVLTQDVLDFFRAQFWTQKNVSCFLTKLISRNFSKNWMTRFPSRMTNKKKLIQQFSEHIHCH